MGRMGALAFLSNTPSGPVVPIAFDASAFEPLPPLVCLNSGPRDLPWRTTTIRGEGGSFKDNEVDCGGQHGCGQRPLHAFRVEGRVHLPCSGPETNHRARDRPDVGRIPGVFGLGSRTRRRAPRFAGGNVLEAPGKGLNGKRRILHGWDVAGYSDRGASYVGAGSFATPLKAVLSWSVTSCNGCVAPLFGR
ncbi:hypothetical protein VNO77_03177 [Canavalia gladiata]|uniref:Uncharacterized protein n=1 Tax=Canavalia gladiata TaxID=3824 RepID=A0AAN9MZW8_CANGL